MKTKVKKQNWSKKAFEMSWSVTAWIILSLIVLFILFAILKKGTAPGMSVFETLRG